jgi:hypothetical protein
VFVSLESVNGCQGFLCNNVFSHVVNKQLKICFSLN